MGWIIGGFVLLVIIGCFCSGDTHKSGRQQHDGRNPASSRHLYSAQPQRSEYKAEPYTPNIPHSSKYL